VPANDDDAGTEAEETAADESEMTDSDAEIKLNHEFSSSAVRVTACCCVYFA